MRRRALEIDRDHSRFRPALRTPILSSGRQFRYEFSCYEKQQRVIVRVQPRFRGIELARTEDAPLLDYIAVRAHRQLGGTEIGEVQDLAVSVGEIAAYYGLPPGSEREITDSLRRLTGTRLTVERWKGRTYASAFPMLEAKLSSSGHFVVTPSAWMSDELWDGELVPAPRSSARLTGPRFRLDGWARSWLGRNPQSGEQVITRRDALARFGPLPEGAVGTPWQQILAAVEANDLPDHELELIERRGEPALLVTARQKSAMGSPFRPSTQHGQTDSEAVFNQQDGVDRDRVFLDNEDEMPEITI